MNLFKKKEKRINKVLVMTLEFIIAIILFLLCIGIKWLKDNIHEDTNIIRLESQEVKKINFVDFVADYTEENPTIQVSLINYNSEKVSVSNLVINLYSSDNICFSSIKINPEQIILEPNEEYIITQSISTSARVNKVEYIID